MDFEIMALHSSFNVRVLEALWVSKVYCQIEIPNSS